MVAWFTAACRTGWTLAGAWNLLIGVFVLGFRSCPNLGFDGREEFDKESAFTPSIPVYERPEWNRSVCGASDKLRDSWELVAQFDHGPDSPYGHEIELEGLHLDLYKEGQRYRVVRSKFLTYRSTTPLDTVSNISNGSTRHSSRGPNDGTT